MTVYAELHALSNFTFLRGASHPEELVETAVELNYDALAITDECTVSGIVRAHVAGKKKTLKKLIIGSEFQLDTGLKLVVLARNHTGYKELCALITCGRRATKKGSYKLTANDFRHGLLNCFVLWVPDNHLLLSFEDTWIIDAFSRRLWIAVELHSDGHEKIRVEKLRHLSVKLKLPLVASGDVHMHCRNRRFLQDTLTAIRKGITLEQTGFSLYPNGERYLRAFSDLEKIYPRGLLEETAVIAGEIDFCLDELCYEYPNELVPYGETPETYLRALTEVGMRKRWPNGVPEKVKSLVKQELKLIRELRYEAYFLTVYDIVTFARNQGILCQGRGSAANSAVCFCLGITEVDPARMSTLVERFISKERNEPPDIDVDFEHERREEVIQYIYRKYGRDRAALVASIITYRPKSALRDVGRALGLSELQVGRLAKSIQWWDGKEVDKNRILEAGLDPESPVIRKLLYLVNEILGFPRHLSQHVGGFIISDRALTELVPVENAAMKARTVIQWEKNDLEDLGLLKVDVLGLGMLTVIRRAFDLIRHFNGRDYTLATIPAEDQVVYDMICKGDTMGVFQIESRAQMAMLPRLKPRCYYDLVIEVAIIRPGPIQGDMVHPYLRRRNGKEPIEYPNEELKRVLQRTLGVPIFQEQVMQIAVVAAGFTPGEADNLRRAMATWKRRGGMKSFQEKLLFGMELRGYSVEFSQQIFKQILGFGEYGFPESHSASFALLVYVSSWLKCRFPAAFTCALLNSQPVGFYSVAQLIQDARSHGIEVRPVDVNQSQWDSSLECNENDEAVLRLGLRHVNNLSEGTGKLIFAKRIKPYRDIGHLVEKTLIRKRELSALANAGALKSLAGHRYKVRWTVAGVEEKAPLFSSLSSYEALPMLRRPTEEQDMVADYQSLGLTLGRHPVELVRHRLDSYSYVTSNCLQDMLSGQPIRTAGLVITKQRPSSARGVIFITLEDETGHSNLVLFQKISEKQRSVVINAKLIGVHGELQKEGKVSHIIVSKIIDHTELLDKLAMKTRDFC